MQHAYRWLCQHSTIFLLHYWMSWFEGVAAAAWLDSCSTHACHHGGGSSSSSQAGVLCGCWSIVIHCGCAGGCFLWMVFLILIGSRACAAGENSSEDCLYCRFFARPLAELITSQGRDILQSTVDLVNDLGVPGLEVRLLLLQPPSDIPFCSSVHAMRA